MDRGWDPIVPGWSWLYSIRPPADQRLVGRWGWGLFPHCTGRYQLILVISVFIPGLSELYMYMWVDYDPGMGPYRPQMTVTLCTIPGQRPTSDQTKRPYQVIHVFLLFSSKIRG